MKQWENPNLYILSGSATEAGGLGGDADGVHYDVQTQYGSFDLIGTSGPALPLPVNQQ